MQVAGATFMAAACICHISPFHALLATTANGDSALGVVAAVASIAIAAPATTAAASLSRAGRRNTMVHSPSGPPVELLIGSDFLLRYFRGHLGRNAWRAEGNFGTRGGRELV